MAELSRATYERLRTELDELTGQGRVEIAQKIEAARALGDLSENGDYHAAKESQGHMERRIRELEHLLRDARVIDAVEDTGAVVVGSAVTVDFDGDEEQYLVGNPEERREGYTTVSPESPMGKALMGRAVGDEVTWEVRGQTFSATVLRIGT